MRQTRLDEFGEEFRIIGEYFDRLRERILAFYIGLAFLPVKVHEQLTLDRWIQ